jgi:biotin synthase
MSEWDALARMSLEGEALAREDALSVLRAPDIELLPLLAAAFEVRKHHHGLKVRIHVLQNAKSGACPEDCRFCSQSKHASTPIERYALKSREEIVDGARRAAGGRAWKY